MPVPLKRMLSLVVGSIGLLAAMPAPALAGTQDAALVAKGQALYSAQKCSICHAIEGKGNKMSPLDGVGKKLSAAEVRQWMTNPQEMTAKTKSIKKPPMPNRYGTLPAADLDALVAYLQSLN